MLITRIGGEVILVDKNTLMELPNSSDRTMCVGRTGTGKTIFGLWLLSLQAIDKMPWIVVDFKGEEQLDKIPNTREIDFRFVPGKDDTGLFILRCTPFDVENGELDKYLIKIWERENCGIFIDECYILGNSKALNLCLTQGRSKHLPMILCSQRPVYCSRFCFSEASFIVIFDLNDDRDMDVIEGFTPLDYSEESELEKHQCFFYDVSENEIVRFNPVSMKKMEQRFEEKLPERRIRI